MKIKTLTPPHVAAVVVAVGLVTALCAGLPGQGRHTDSPAILGTNAPAPSSATPSTQAADQAALDEAARLTLSEARASMAGTTATAAFLSTPPHARFASGVHIALAPPERGGPLLEDAEELAPDHFIESFDVAPEGEPLPPDDHHHRLITVASGHTLASLLATTGVGDDQARAAIDALSKAYDVHTLQIGQQLALTFDDAGVLTELELHAAVDRAVRVTRGEKGAYTATASEIHLERRMAAATGVVRTSLYESAITAGVPLRVLSALIRSFSYSVDFQRDMQPGDHFSVLYERYYNPDGEPVREGELLYASLTLDGEESAIYRYAPPGSTPDYYNGDGESIRKALLRTPIDGARITSGFGMRMHPLLGFTKMHKGVDFGAPIGTPIYAAGDGVIEDMGVKNGYGNYVRVRHNPTLSTAYAHMSRFASTHGRGAHVEQGDVIGYVGMSGMATGPHLHFEVLINNVQVNPLSVDIPVGRALAGTQLRDFKQAVAALNQDYRAALPALNLQVAHATGCSAGGDDGHC